MDTIEVVDGLIGVLPLTGRTIVVTRAEAQAAELVEALEAQGADVLRLPTIRIDQIVVGGTAMQGPSVFQG